MSTFRDLERFARLHGVRRVGRFVGGPLRWYYAHPERVSVVRGKRRGDPREVFPPEVVALHDEQGIPWPTLYAGPLSSLSPEVEAEAARLLNEVYANFVDERRRL